MRFEQALSDIAVEDDVHSPRKSRGTSYDEQNRLGTLEGITHATTTAQSTPEIHWCLTMTDLNCSEPVETTVDSPLAAVTTVEAPVLQTPEAYLPHHQPPLGCEMPI